MPISNPSPIGKGKKKTTSLISQSELGSISVGTLVEEDRHCLLLPREGIFVIHTHFHVALGNKPELCIC